MRVSTSSKLFDTSMSTSARSSKTAMAPALIQPPLAMERSAFMPRPFPYGGAGETRAKGASVPASPSLVASRRQILVAPVRCSAWTLPRRAARASALSSTNRQKRAPRDSASRPSAPEPANRSRIRAPSKFTRGAPCSSTLNSAWRTLSEVGRVARPFGASIRALLNLPATILMRLVSYLYHNQNTSVVAPGLVPGIHEFQLPNHKNVDGRGPGHDERTG